LQQCEEILDQCNYSCAHDKALCDGAGGDDCEAFYTNCLKTCKAQKTERQGSGQSFPSYLMIKNSSLPAFARERSNYLLPEPTVLATIPFLYLKEETNLLAKWIKMKRISSAIVEKQWTN